jgi:hypothetical protein
MLKTQQKMNENSGSSVAAAESAIRTSYEKIR